MFVTVNNAFYKRLSQNTRIFNAQSLIRNVDCLHIGECTDDVVDLKNDLFLHVPYANLSSSFEIIRATHSILKENGTIVLALRKSEENKKRYSIFEMIYYHQITLNRLNLNRKNKVERKFPLLFSPKRSIAFIIKKPKNYTECNCPSKEIIDFCNERGYKLIYRNT